MDIKIKLERHEVEQAIKDYVAQKFDVPKEYYVESITPCEDAQEFFDGLLINLEPLKSDR